jgi:putative acyl-CoA dehydrogenase
MATHEAFNQAPPRVDVDEFGSNAALVEGVARYHAAWAVDDLTRVGRYVGTQ